MREPAEGHWLLAWSLWLLCALPVRVKVCCLCNESFLNHLENQCGQHSYCLVVVTLGAAFSGGIEYRFRRNINSHFHFNHIHNRKEGFPPTISGVDLRKHFRNFYRGKCYSHLKERDAFSSVPSDPSHNNITWAQVEQAVRVYHYHLRKGKHVLPSES